MKSGVLRIRKTTKKENKTWGVAGVGGRGSIQLIEAVAYHDSATSINGTIYYLQRYLYLAADLCCIFIRPPEQSLLSSRLLKSHRFGSEAGQKASLRQHRPMPGESPRRTSCCQLLLLLQLLLLFSCR